MSTDLLIIILHNFLVIIIYQLFWRNGRQHRRICSILIVKILRTTQRTYFQVYDQIHTLSQWIHENIHNHFWTAASIFGVVHSILLVLNRRQRGQSSCQIGLLCTERTWYWPESSKWSATEHKQHSISVRMLPSECNLPIWWWYLLELKIGPCSFATQRIWIDRCFKVGLVSAMIHHTLIGLLTPN